MLVILSLNTNSTDRERVRYRIDFHFGPLGGQADLVSDLQKLVCRLYEYILVSSDSKCRVQDKLGNRASTVTGGQMRLEVRTFNFEKLSEADLYVDAWYEGGHRGNAGDDPLNALLSVSNQGGFRYRGNLDELQLVVLISTLNDPDWPDTMDQETGVFTCYGDNKHPGRGLHETPRHGNEILRQLFDLAHSGAPGRS